MAKRKLSLSLDSDLLDNLAAIFPAANRSASIEQILRVWLQQRAKAQLDAEVEAYYRGMTAEELAEDAAWARMGEETLRTVEY